MKYTSIQQTGAGLFATSLRLVLGWTYFSAFWRRLILENKLDPEQAGYIGEKRRYSIGMGNQGVVCAYVCIYPKPLYSENKKRPAQPYCSIGGNGSHNAPC